MITLYKALLISFLSIGALIQPSSLEAQEVSARASSAEEAPVQKMLETQEFVFVAEQAFPMRGRSLQLTSYYQVKLSGDTVASELPYFGRAFTAPINPGQGGIFFTSTLFEYEIQARRKGGWNVEIKPKDVRDVQQMQMTVFANGTATLLVTSNNRQPITFRGYVKPLG